MAAKRIEAIGDNGPELVPADEVVEIRAIPVGPGNMVIPATIRAIRKRGEGMPTRLRRIMRPNTRANPSPFVHVFFDCTPFARYMTENGPVMGDWSSCGLRGQSMRWIRFGRTWRQVSVRGCWLLRGVEGTTEHATARPASRTRDTFARCRGVPLKGAGRCATW